MMRAEDLKPSAFYFAGNSVTTVASRSISKAFAPPGLIFPPFNINKALLSVIYAGASVCIIARNIIHSIAGVCPTMTSVKSAIGNVIRIFAGAIGAVGNAFRAVVGVFAYATTA